MKYLATLIAFVGLIPHLLAVLFTIAVVWSIRVPINIIATWFVYEKDITDVVLYAVRYTKTTLKNLFVL